MQKKVLSILLTLTVVVCTLVCLVACNSSNDNSPTDFVTGQYPATLPNRVSAQDSATISAGLDQNATQEQKKDAVMALYNIANSSRIEVETSLVIQESDAGISGGTVLMHAFNLRSGDKWFYQLATQVDIGNPILNEIMSLFAGFLKVGYNYDGNIYYFGKIGPEFECDCTLETFPYATYVIPNDKHAFENSLTPEEFKTELHYLDSQFEICNMKFCAEIIADDPVITYHAGEHYYTVEFAVDMSSDPALLQEWFALPKEDMAVGGQTLEKYNSYTAVLEVWDNGYAKSYQSRSDRSAGMGSGKPVDTYNYLWNENEIMALLGEDVRIDHNLYNDEDFDSIDDYIVYYSHPEMVEPSNKLNSLQIIGIVIGCIAFVVIAIVVIIEVLVRAGKLPAIANRRAQKKARRLAKKGEIPVDDANDNVFEESLFEQSSSDDAQGDAPVDDQDNLPVDESEE